MTLTKRLQFNEETAAEIFNSKHELATAAALGKAPAAVAEVIPQHVVTEALQAMAAVTAAATAVPASLAPQQQQPAGAATPLSPALSVASAPTPLPRTQVPAPGTAETTPIQPEPKPAKVESPVVAAQKVMKRCSLEASACDDVAFRLGKLKGTESFVELLKGDAFTLRSWYPCMCNAGIPNI